MPCTICRETLMVPPCEHRTGVIGGFEFEYLIINEGKGWFKASRMQAYITGYKELHHKCPCKECLIKTICSRDNSITGISDICEKYHDLIKSIGIKDE
jgi:hypothetical protein